ncbi:hypothetical protein [Flavobacterium muglaense]|uniref:Uncharacterized protein n=1 Tax=Flavobacterium muglaense TaxID=2764716 RepID=A0A923MZM7_9FLAO|nr:hypothetical protein [Flavobacterium muglaense]MBC5837883.1 hypothetical protein [Flavobacterium muglaense]MBC5844352.1 hypothetical protein [Flavobacterium muglaense]
MLNKGVRDEKKVKIDNMLSTLLSLVFVPKFWNIEDTSVIDNQLTDLSLSTAILCEISERDLITLLSGYGFDWEDKERFADFLMTYSKNNQFDFLAKANAIYNHIQMDSKTFSFDIFNKIAAIKSKI